MWVTRLKLKNWRNFKQADITLRDRVYLIGPNASGKSNLLDVFRFLRDIAKVTGGGLQKAVADRHGITKLRCLQARTDPEVAIEVELAETLDNPIAEWAYAIGFRSEGKGQQRLLLNYERVLHQGEPKLDRPDAADKADPARLTQTHLEQINANADFRPIAEFFSGVTYLHLVPQLLKYSDEIGGKRLDNDPFGQGFLERIARCQSRTRESRLNLLLLEEPELSLNDAMVEQIPLLLDRLQRQARYRRQILLSTHSGALLRNKGIDVRGILRLEPEKEGTRIVAPDEAEQRMVESGLSPAEVLLPKARPGHLDQLDFFR